MLKFVAFLAFVSVSYAAIARFPAEEKPIDLAGQDGCYISKLKRVLPYDVKFYPNIDCAVYICNKSTNETLYETCGARAIRDGCRRTAIDNSKQYPACCDQEVCDGSTTTPTPTTTTEASQESSA
ncbi:uncharacterized protein LOC125236066 [Leguminivora glycinivorella]|uniref:uncharacterized protein LOC125236066 n=1 Tax=Leguminivora glycinivorella TaxID=1035111 RepID=UPI00200FFCD1|nr:uncharacterized protein LOC125236066 [Leguminivora glycinivorella]